MRRLLIIGAGTIGTAAARAALDEGVVDSICGVVDPNPEVLESVRERFGAPGYLSSADLPVARAGDRAVVAFSSEAEEVAPEIVRLVTTGYHVVSPCEELALPDRHIRNALRTSASSNGRVVIATGANPGFAMDRLPLMAAAACRSVKRVEVTRRVDTATHRENLPARTGFGLTVDEATRRIRAGSLGHIGLSASVKLLARGLGWPLHDVVERINPVIGLDGLVAGVHQQAELRTPDSKALLLDLTLSYGLDDPVDSVVVEGIPRLELLIPGGFPGVDGTTSQITRALQRCNELEPGFYRPTDLPLRFG